MDLQNFSHKPGIYQMFSKEGLLLYVGKARNLRKRIASYFRDQGLSVKTQSLMRQVESIETIITASDTEALLLESNLIKKYRPKYNVLLRDDKSYPYLYISTDKKYPRLQSHRGARTGKGSYFGPYPSMGSVRENLSLLQKLFLLRPCSDSFFKNRSRPCLQYQIKRCTAPCVGYISEVDYAKKVNQAVLFLQGKSDVVIQGLTKQMDEASSRLAYEEAAHFRDQILQLRRLQEEQCISGGGGNLDVVGMAFELGVAAVSVLFIRQGRVIGQKLFFPQVGIASSVEEVLTGFLMQYYASGSRYDDRIEKVVLSDKLSGKEAVQEVLESNFSRKCLVTDFKGVIYKQWQLMAKENAQHGLQNHLREKATAIQQLQKLRDLLGMSSGLDSVECFDISHSQGNSTVASCVVFDKNGANHAAYRRFNIDDVKPGDDYAAMEQVLRRRYKKKQELGKLLPGLVIVDGGKGQLGAAMEVFDELQIHDVFLLGVSKGPDRKPGQEQLWIPGRERALHLSEDSEVLHLIQFIRDEAHRFAITAHRKKRDKAFSRSSLEDVPGVGALRRRALLKHFGGMQVLKDASVLEISKVRGISERLAKAIYDHFHA